AQKGERVGDLAEADSQVAPEVGLVALSKWARQRQCRVVGRKRATRVRPQQFGVADLVPGNRGVTFEPTIFRQRIGKALQDVTRAFRYGERCGRVALIEVKCSELVECGGFEADELGRALASLRELALQVLHPLEDQTDQLKRHAGAVAQILRQ